MRFFKVITFVLLMFLSLSAWALADYQKAYLTDKKGYTVQQIQAYEAKVKARQEARKNGQTMPEFTDSEQQMYQALTGNEAREYGQTYGTSAWERALARISDATGLTDADLSRHTFGVVRAAFESVGGGSWLSPIFERLFDAINQLTTAMNNQLADPVIKILALLLAFYILFTVTKHILTFTAIEPAKLLSEIFFPLGRCIFAVWAIKNWNYIFENMLSPVLSLAINFGSQIMDASSVSTSSSTGTISGGVQAVSRTCTTIRNTQGLSVEVCNSILGFLATLSNSLIVWMAIGVTFVVDCWGGITSFFLPNFKMLFVGIILFIFAFMVYIAFPLKLLDAMFRLMFITVMFPLWCLFWVIPQTRNYCKKMIEMLVHVMATFLSASIILVMIISILQNLFSGIPLGEIVSLLQAGRSEDAMNRIGFSTSGLFYSVCLLFLCFHLVSKVDYFANLFGKLDSLGMGGKEGLGGKTMAVINSTPQALRMGKNAAVWGAGIAKKGAGEIWGTAKEGFNRHRAKSYNENVPGGTARQSPRLWTAAIPGMGLWDAHKAKDQIGDYSRTQDVSVSGVEKAKDGSKSQTYSNRTVDKYGNTLAQMKETTTTSKDKTKQSVDRQRTSFDAAGEVARNTNVKKDFENGNAVRKTTTKMNKDGSRIETSVDKDGNVSKMRFSASGQKLSSEKLQVQFDPTTRKMKFGIRVLETYGADGSVTSTKRIGPDGKPIP